ncbi:uncharacterized protein LOC116213718 [Punica granatum]|uniref:Uncharacterized protein LOC116213718 n=1 Tax=Punica granatum TaxID=22663 RepID=A0A6P8EGS2_PUNGR|nr:uncharacterized protein LOC116213718 [Punica granatum]
MAHSLSCQRLDRVTPPLEEIARIWTALRPVDRHYIAAFVGDVHFLATRRVDWNFLEAAIAFWNPSRAVFDIQGTELTPTIEEYRTLIGRTAIVHDIVEPNFHTTRPTLVSRLLGVPTTRLNAELAYSGSTEIAIEKLLLFIESRAHRVQGDFLRKDLCHAVLLLIFGTLLFPRSHSLIDAALAGVVLQVVGGHGYEVALVVETVRSLDRVLRTRDRRIRGSPILLQIWFQSHANPFGLVRSVMNFNGSESIISRLLSLVRVEESKISEWIKIFREIPPRGFKWRAAWMPPGPAALRCPDFNGVPLVSHAGSTAYFPARVMRQFGILQTVSEDTARAKFEHTWREDQTSVDRQRDIERVLDAWRTVVIERPYFPEHPTLEEQDFQATEEYVLRFYRWGPTAHEDSADSPRAEDNGPTGASLTPNMVIQAELANLRAERDHFRWEVAEKDEQVVDQRQLQRELAQARAELQRREQELARANVALERFRKRARGGPRTP